MEQNETIGAAMAPEQKKTASKKKTFSKENLLRSKIFVMHRDALTVCLKDTERYTTEQAERLLREFMKGKV